MTSQEQKCCEKCRNGAGPFVLGIAMPYCHNSACECHAPQEQKPVSWREAEFERRFVVEQDFTYRGGPATGNPPSRVTHKVLKQDIYGLEKFIEEVAAKAKSEGRNEAVDYILRIAWEGAAPDTKLVNNSILEDARREHEVLSAAKETKV